MSVSFEEASQRVSAGGMAGAPREVDEASTVLEEEDMSREQLQMIKARTMFQMVEELQVGSLDAARKLLFLSNPQADLLASSSASIQKLIDALEVPKPKLVINLLSSQGFSRFTQSLAGGFFDPLGEDVGLVSNKAPFLTPDDEYLAIQRIDTFMADVLIPLAAQTNAFIIVNGVGTACVLSASLTRVYSMQRAKWGETCPFTIFSTTGDIVHLYLNPDLETDWRSLRRASRTWRGRDKKINELVTAKFHGRQQPQTAVDLDPNAQLLLIVDTITKEKIGDRRPFNRLKNELMRHLSSTLPSLAIKAGHSDKQPLEKSLLNTSSLGVAVDAMNSGTPLLFLDVRTRPLIEASDRARYIEAAIEHYNTAADELLAHGVCETLDACAIAYFREVLFGNGCAGHGMTVVGQQANDRLFPIHEALSMTQRDSRSTGVDGAFAPATVDQVHQVSVWLAKRFFSDGWLLVPDRAEREARGEDCVQVFGERMYAMSSQTRMLLTDPNFHHLNLTDREAGTLVSKLVRLDRLPKHNSREGLLLLREAWCEYDVAMYLADRYKLVCKVLFMVQLFMTWSVVMFTSVSTFLDSEDNDSDAHSVFYDSLNEVIFAVTVLIGMVVSIDQLVSAKAKWRQLRGGAGALLSIIWRYRARVGLFEIKPNSAGPSQPEIELRDTVNAWRDELVAGADLATTNLEKIHKKSVYRHFQFEGGKLLRGEAGMDDHHSPVQPAKYIALRIKPAMAFYTRRIPLYTRHRMLLKCTLLLCVVASSFLSRYQQALWTVVVTSASAAMTSWIEFSDSTRKVERYTRLVHALKKLLSWWASLSEVEKASIDIIAKLITTSEDILSEERLAWISTANKHGENGHGDDNTQGEKTSSGENASVLRERVNSSKVYPG